MKKSVLLISMVLFCTSLVQASDNSHVEVDKSRKKDYHLVSRKHIVSRIRNRVRVGNWRDEVYLSAKDNGERAICGLDDSTDYDADIEDIARLREHRIANDAYCWMKLIRTEQQLREYVGVSSSSEYDPAISKLEKHPNAQDRESIEFKILTCLMLAKDILNQREEIEHCYCGVQRGLYPPFYNELKKLETVM